MAVKENGDFQEAWQMLQRVQAQEWAQQAGALFGWYYLLVVAGFSPKQAMGILLQKMWEEK